MMRKSLGFFAAGGLASLAMLTGAQAKGIRVGTSPTEVAQFAAEVARGT